MAGRTPRHPSRHPSHHPSRHPSHHPSHHRGLTASWLAIAALTLVPACTTVTRTPLASPTANDQPGTANGQTLPGGGPNALTSNPTGTPAPGSAGLGAAGAGGDTGSSTLSSGEIGTVGGPGLRLGSSACTKTVKIGVSYSSDLATGLAIVGNPTAAQQAGNFVQQVQALNQREADFVNAHGGLAGCRIVLVYHDFKALGSDGFSGESQTECADFAEDQHVFAVITGTGGALENRTLLTCLAQHQVVLVDGAGTAEYTPSQQDFMQYRGYLYQPSNITPDRWAPFIDGLNSAGYFPKGAKVGILLADDGTGDNERLVNDLWKPRLAALGIKPTVFTFSQIEGYSDVSSVTGQFSSAVLQFKAAHIDHVMTTPDGGDSTIFFTQVASSQHYHPRYALNTINSLATWPTEPSDQRPNALGVSFSIADLGAAPDPKQMASNHANPSRTACEARFAGKTGSAPLNVAYAVCDDYELLQTALAGAAAVTPAALLGGVERLGTTFPLSNGYDNAGFGLARYNGGRAIRIMVWDEPSQTWHYVSPPSPVP
jgi:hypothetical protein